MRRRAGTGAAPADPIERERARLNRRVSVVTWICAVVAALVFTTKAWAWLPVLLMRLVTPGATTYISARQLRARFEWIRLARARGARVRTRAPLRQASRTCINVKPSRLFPGHAARSVARESSGARPFPQIQSSGSALTSTRVPVEAR